MTARAAAPPTARGTPAPGGDRSTSAAADASGKEGDLLGIGSAAARTGVTERSLRYYQELGLIRPSARTKGGMRRYSEADLDRVARIRELQTVLGLNLEEIAGVLRNEDRSAQIRSCFDDGSLPVAQRRELLGESLELAGELRHLVETKRSALEAFLSDLDDRIACIRAALESTTRRPPPNS